MFDFWTSVDVVINISHYGCCFFVCLCFGQKKAFCESEDPCAKSFLLVLDFIRKHITCYSWEYFQCVVSNGVNDLHYLFAKTLSFVPSFSTVQ